MSKSATLRLYTGIAHLAPVIEGFDITAPEF
jgi:hypothetical protein